MFLKIENDKNAMVAISNRHKENHDTFRCWTVYESGNPPIFNSKTKNPAVKGTLSYLD